jgi:hypothetical protein
LALGGTASQEAADALVVSVDLPDQRDRRRLSEQMIRDQTDVMSLLGKIVE